MSLKKFIPVNGLPGGPNQIKFPKKNPHKKKLNKIYYPDGGDVNNNDEDYRTFDENFFKGITTHEQAIDKYKTLGDMAMSPEYLEAAKKYTGLEWNVQQTPSGATYTPIVPKTQSQLTRDESRANRQFRLNPETNKLEQLHRYPDTLTAKGLSPWIPSNKTMVLAAMKKDKTLGEDFDYKSLSKLGDTEILQKYTQIQPDSSGRYVFQEGGEFIDVELDEEEIAALRAQGYKIDEL